MNLIQKHRNALADAAVFVGCVAATALIANLTLWADLRLGIIRSEMSFTENAQLLFVALTIFTFVRFMRERPEFRHACALVVGFFCAIFVRECDGYLDAVVHGFWVVPALCATAVALFFGLRDRRACLREGLALLASPMLVVVAGVVLLLVWSRLFGMSGFWRALMGESYMREVKVVAEEGAELLSYGVILTGAILLRRRFRRRVPAEA
ncbi:hypothetical protein [Candidatus Spyradosoma sp. SGI.093]|uniref:hypothetical protein n=1 Tax=Candidatus Spyradosoma sp. SGI.093 TaxID=3420583 RepID=UPI003D03C4FB